MNEIEKIQPEQTDPNHSAGSPKRPDLLNPLPKLTKSFAGWTFVCVVVYLWGLHGTEASPQAFYEGVPNILDFLTRLLPPQFEMRAAEWSGFSLPFTDLQVQFANEISFSYPVVVMAIIESLQMAIIGTSIGFVLALPLAVLGARNTSPAWWIYSTTRFLFNANRAIPDIVYALVFVAAVGLGPFGGVMALAIGSVGSLGKMFSESIEAIDPQPLLAIRSTGAGSVSTFLYGVIPQAMPLIISYSIYYFEHNVRSATILGLVGAGGVGFEIDKYIRLFQYQHLMGAILLIIVTVTVIDRFSDWLRKKII